MTPRTFTRRAVLPALALPFLPACGGGGGGPAPARVAIYGDSVAYGWQPGGDRLAPTPAENLAALLAGAVVLDYSEPGQSVLDARLRRDDGADLVVLRYGVADAAYHTPWAAYWTAYAGLVRDARGLGLRVLIVGPTATPCAGVSLPPLFLVPGVPLVRLDGVPADLVDCLHPALAYSRACDVLIAEAVRGVLDAAS